MDCCWELQSHGVSSKLTHMLCLSAVLSIENYCVLLDWQLQPHGVKLRLTDMP